MNIPSFNSFPSLYTFLVGDSSLSWSKAHLGVPFVLVLISVNALVLHVAAVDAVVTGVVHDWHLEQEGLAWGGFCSGHDV